MRDVIKTGNKAKIPQRLTIRGNEISQLYDLYDKYEDMGLIIICAFAFGYEIGHRQGLRDSKASRIKSAKQQ